MDNCNNHRVRTATVILQENNEVDFDVVTNATTIKFTGETFLF